MPATLHLLHSMRTREYLELALTNGLMLTEHEVRYAPAEDFAGWQLLLESILPLLKARLVAIGAPWELISEERRNVLLMCLGTVKCRVPMLCFTEIPEGRQLSDHHLLFGAYGLAVKRQWLEANGGDRVIYVGHTSSVSRRLHNIVTQLLISKMAVSPSGEVGFMDSPIFDVIELAAYIEARQNLVEFEWRIVGAHALKGGKSDAGKCLSIPLDQIEAVLVQNEGDVSHFEAFISNIAKIQNTQQIPRVIQQPGVL